MAIENVPHRVDDFDGVIAEGYGKGYRYAHSESEQRAQQTHLPERLIGRKFYEPKEIGFEKQIKEKLDLLNSDFEKK